MLNYLADLLLYILGWNLEPLHNIYPDIDEEKIILIFSHSSFWDFFIFLLYHLREGNFNSALHILMKPQPFKYWGWFLSKYNFIPASRMEDKNSGSIERIKNCLKDKNNFTLLISPQGKIVKGEWRSGYYYLAKELKAKIRVCGLDYYNHKFYVNIEELNPAEEKLEEINKKILNTISEIPTLYEKGNDLKYGYGEVSPIDFNTVTNAILLPYLLYLFLKLDNGIILIIQSIFNFSISINYHYNKEKNSLMGELDFLLNIFFLMLYFFILWWENYTYRVLSFYNLTLWAMVYGTYYISFGRSFKNHGKRYPAYTYLHPIFHMLVGLALSYPLSY